MSTTAVADAPATPATYATPAEGTGLWEGRTPDAATVSAWVEAFHRDGYVLIPRVLSPERCAALRADLDAACPHQGGAIECRSRMFESSSANLALFDLEPIVTLAETILGEDRNYGKNGCHVMHNNSFRTSKGGGWSHWHQDDSSHFIVTHGEPPTNIHLPCLLLTCNYYLTDQPDLINGPAQVVPGSHKFGKFPPSDLVGTPYEKLVVTCGAMMGAAMVFNNQTWHRGAPNHSDRMRYVTQVSYARKLIGHKYEPFMNYQMPAHCLEGASERKKRLLGFLPNGPYG